MIHTFATQNCSLAAQRPGQWGVCIRREGDELAGLVSVPLHETEPVWLAAWVHLPRAWMTDAARTLRDLAAVIGPDAYGPAMDVGEFRVPVALRDAPVEVGTLAEILGAVGGIAGSIYGGPVGGAAGAAGGGALGAGLDELFFADEPVGVRWRFVPGVPGNGATRYADMTDPDHRRGVWALADAMARRALAPGTGDHFDFNAAGQQQTVRPPPSEADVARRRDEILATHVLVRNTGSGPAGAGVAQQQAQQTLAALVRVLGPALAGAAGGNVNTSNLAGLLGGTSGAAGGVGALAGLLGPMLGAGGGGGSGITPQALQALLAGLGGGGGGSQASSSVAALLGALGGLAGPSGGLGALGGLVGPTSSTPASSDAGSGAVLVAEQRAGNRPSSVPAQWWALTSSQTARLPASARRWIARARAALGSSTSTSSTSTSSTPTSSTSTSSTPTSSTSTSSTSGPTSSTSTSSTAAELAAALARVMGASGGSQGDTAGAVVGALSNALRGAL